MLKKNLVILAAISAFVISSLFILSNDDSESVKIVSNNNMSHHDDLHSNKYVKSTETIATSGSGQQSTTMQNRLQPLIILKDHCRLPLNLFMKP